MEENLSFQFAMMLTRKNKVRGVYRRKW